MSPTCSPTLIVCALLFANCTVASAKITIPSPNGECVVTLQTVEGRPTWSLKYHGQTVIRPSRLGLQLRAWDDAFRAPRWQVSLNEVIHESFENPWGKCSPVDVHYSKTHVDLLPRGIRHTQLCFQVHDDAVAFCYRVVTPGSQTTVQSESTELRLADGFQSLFTACEDYQTSHEHEYAHVSAAALPHKTLLDLPLVIYKANLAAAVTEARLTNFPGMYLFRDVSPDNADVDLQTRLSPLLSDPSAVSKQDGSFTTPWRVILLADHPGKLIESNVVASLNAPPRGDVSWIKPGKTTWNWWNGWTEPGLGFAPGMNFETQKYYIDFCAKYGIEYHAVVADERPWYVQTAAGYAPGEDSNALLPRPELQLPRVLAYAKQQGVGIRLWVHWKALIDRLDEAFARYESWGVNGLMVDFLDRDDQEMVQICERILQSAMKHHLTIQLHGAYKPTGLQRTYPALMNKEGVLNLENLKWSHRCTPKHNIQVAYTRNLAGPLDYHLGGFRNVAAADFTARDKAPYVIGTRCHHLAMYVVYENPLPMVCDFPSIYQGQSGIEFIAEVPTVWHETRFVAGEIGAWIVVARRSGQRWYVGAMTDKSRTIDVPVSFLGAGRYIANVWSDGEDGPATVRRSRHATDAGKSLTLRLAHGGGAVLRITPVRDAVSRE